MKLEWENGYAVHVSEDGDGILLRANAAGLRSLAHHLNALAGDGIPQGTRILLDDWTSLEDGSKSFIIQKTEF